MRAFSQLLDDLVYTRSRNTKLRLIGDYLKATPDPDRGVALAALTGSLSIPAVKGAAIRAIAEERVDPVLLYMSRDYVGDMAETVSLLWPTPGGEPEMDDGTVSISAAVERLASAGRVSAPRVLAEMLDHLDASGRFAILKLATGNLRIGISARLAKQAFANAFELNVDAVEEVWHGLQPPYPQLFDWAERRGPQPMPVDLPVFRPFMLAHPLEDTVVSLEDYAAEWKWDGIRVQLVRTAGQTRLYSRTGDDISASFPEIASTFESEGVLDGELLVRGSDQGSADLHGGAAASFNALQQRLGRKAVSAKMQVDYPAFVRLYDILFDGREDVRGLPWVDRRLRLEGFVPKLDPERFDLSTLIEARDFDELSDIRTGARDAAIEGVMLKRRDSLCSRPPRRPVVQMEARSADRRLRANVRAARVGQAVELLLRLYVRLLGRGRPVAAGRQGLLRLHRRGTALDRPVGAQPYRRPLRPGPRGRKEPGARGRVRFDPFEQPTQVGPRNAIPANQPNPHRQAGGGSGPDRDLAGDGDLNGLRAALRSRG